MDDPADLSSEDRPGWHLLDGCGSTRNRKVVGSNPTSGSKAAGQGAYRVLQPMALLASLIIPHARTWPREVDRGRHGSEVSADRRLVAAIRIPEPSFQGTLLP
jgi:hypothetical protein